MRKTDYLSAVAFDAGSLAVYGGEQSHHIGQKPSIYALRHIGAETLNEYSVLPETINKFMLEAKAGNNAGIEGLRIFSKDSLRKYGALDGVVDICLNIISDENSPGGNYRSAMNLLASFDAATLNECGKLDNAIDAFSSIMNCDRHQDFFAKPAERACSKLISARDEMGRPSSP